VSDNATMLQCFEWYLPEDGTFWEKVKEEAPSFSRMGITQVWLPPAYKGMAGIHDVGYGVYDMYDLGEFDQKGTVRTKYGTRAQYLEAVKSLHSSHLKVIADIVFNHRMGGDVLEEATVVEDDPANRWEDETPPMHIMAWTKFTFPGRKGRYSSFTWDKSCFDGTDWDQEGRRSAIYRFQNQSWDSEVDTENGNYDYLMGCDLDMSNPRVIQELHDWGRWYLDTVPLDGVRLDALKHIRLTFFADWLRDMQAYAGHPLIAVGEYWNADCSVLLRYLDRNENCLSLFDVPLHYRFADASNQGGSYDMGSILNDTLVQQRPANAVAIVDNHDTQPGQALSSFVMSWFKPLAYAIILLRKDGVPCVFYGDLYGIPHDSIAPVDDLAGLIWLRAHGAYGSQTDYLDDHDVIGWTRSGDAAHPASGMAVIMSDGPGGRKQMMVSPSLGGHQLVDVIGGQPSVTLQKDGSGQFACSGGSVSVYVRRDLAARFQKEAQ